MHSLKLLVVAGKPVDRPDPDEAPAARLQVLLAEPVPVAGGGRRVVIGPVALERQDEAARLVGMLDDHVDSVLGGAELRDDVKAGAFELGLDLDLEVVALGG